MEEFTLDFVSIDRISNSAYTCNTGNYKDSTLNNLKGFTQEFALIFLFHCSLPKPCLLNPGPLFLLENIDQGVNTQVLEAIATATRRSCYSSTGTWEAHRWEVRLWGTKV